jgi:hypothetical protein
MFSASGRPQINRKQLLAKADEIDKNIKQLVAMRDGLRHAADCPATATVNGTFFSYLRPII